MPQSRTNFDQALKEVYGVGLRNAINNTSIVLQEVQTRSDRQSFEGRNATWAVHTRRSNATGARAELGTLPVADRQGYDKAVQTCATIVHSIKLSREVIASSRSNMGAFVSAMDAESQGAEADLKNDIGRQIFGQGRAQTNANTTLVTGVICDVSGAPSSGVITLDNFADAAITDGEMRYFFIGELLDFINPADGTIHKQGAAVTAINFSGRTITVDDATGVVDDDWVVRSGGYNNEFPGLRVLVNDATGDKADGTHTVAVHTLSSASQPAWASVKVGSSTTPISEDLLEQGFDKILTDGDGTEATYILGSFEQRRDIASQLQTQKRYDGRDLTLTAGWKGLNIARGIYVADRYCPSNDGFLINFDQLLWFVLEDFQWDNEDGKVFFKTKDQLAYEARFFGMCSLGAANRNSHCRFQFKATTA